MNEGFIKVHRNLMKWEWYADSKMVHLFIHLIMSANFEDKKWRGKPIKRGQLLTGRKSLSIATGISEQSLRTCLHRLKSTGEIIIKSTNQFSLITVCNYDTYQGKVKEANQPSNQQSTNNQPTSNQQPTTTKESKEYKERQEEEGEKQPLFFNPENPNLIQQMRIMWEKRVPTYLWEGSDDVIAMQGIKTKLGELVKKNEGKSTDRGYKVSDEKIISAWRYILDNADNFWMEKLLPSVNKNFNSISASAKNNQHKSSNGKPEIQIKLKDPRTK